jgi:lipopolysaccharide biosynthesis protein
MNNNYYEEIIFDNSDNLGDEATKWCVYAHYDKANIIQEYVYHALRTIQASGFSICFVSTSELIQPEAANRLRELALISIRRGNLGYDFGSYKSGIMHLSNRGLLKGPVLITNDSVYGPFTELGRTLKNSHRHDLLGITDSIENAYHIQSYFILYSKRLVKSAAFKKFWALICEHTEITDKNWKRKLILENEIGGSQFFLEQGFRIGAAFPYTKILKQNVYSYAKYIESAIAKPRVVLPSLKTHLNATHSYWKTLIELGCPYIKRELLFRNPLLVDISDWAATISANFQYDLDLILGSVNPSKVPGQLIYLDYTKSVTSCLDCAQGVITSAINPFFQDWALRNNRPLAYDFTFDEAFYLEANPDVRNAVENQTFQSGWDHYRAHGYHEERPFKFH